MTFTSKTENCTDFHGFFTAFLRCLNTYPVPLVYSISPQWKCSIPEEVRPLTYSPGFPCKINHIFLTVFSVAEEFLKIIFLRAADFRQKCHNPYLRVRSNSLELKAARADTPVRTRERTTKYFILLFIDGNYLL